MHAQVQADSRPVARRGHRRARANDRGRLRIGRFDVTILLADAAGEIKHFDRCMQQFEDFCVVTESVRNGIPVGVRVVDGAGREVFSAGGAPAEAAPASAPAA